MEWKKVKLGEVCDLIAGFAFKASDFGDYPQKVVKIGDINPPHVTYASMSGIDLSKYDVKKLEKFKVQYGDYVLAMTGATIGKVGKYIDSAFSYLNQRVLMFKPKPEVDAQFVNYVVCSAYFRQYVMNHIDSESAQPNISATTIGKYEFLLPSLDEQHRIATILSSLDDKIENNNRVNSNLEAQAQALFKSWFVDFEPWGGIMPEDWKEGVLGELCVTNKRTHNGKFAHKIEYIDTGSVTKNRLDSVQILDPNVDKIPSRARRSVTEGDILFSSVRPNQNHYMFLFNPASNMVASTGFVVITANRSAYRYYVYQHIIQEEIINHLQAIAEQSVSTYPSINASDITNLKIIIPSDNVLDEYAKIMVRMMAQIDNNNNESQRLAALRDTLLPKLMRGEIAV